MSEQAKVLKEYGVEILSSTHPVSEAFRVGEECVMVQAVGMSNGDRIAVGQILNSNNPVCKAGDMFMPSYCGCSPQLFKEAGDPNDAISTSVENNTIVLDVAGSYYLMYLGDSEDGVNIYIKTLKNVPADAQSARKACCPC